MHQISFWFFQRGITPEREITWTRKKRRSAIFPWGIHIWNFKTLACTVHKIWHALKELTHVRMDNRKPICPLNFSEVGGINRIVASFISIFSQFKAFGQLHKVCQKLTGYVSFFAFKWYLNHITRKPVFTVYDQVRLKLVRSCPTRN